MTTKRTFKDAIAVLQQPIPSELIKERDAGWSKKTNSAIIVSYVEWHVVADILDSAYPEWTSTVRFEFHPFIDVDRDGNQFPASWCVATVALTIDGITREGVGVGYGDTEMGIKKAEHDALKRAAVKFGVGRELYKREATAEEEHGGARGSARQQSPIATNDADRITDKQVKFAQDLASKAAMTPADLDATAQELYGVVVNQLSRHGASLLIDELKSYSGAAAAQQQPAAAQQQQTRHEGGNPASPPQRKAIANMCERLGMDVAAAVLAATDGRKNTVDALTIGEASDVITFLNSAQS